MFERFLRLIGLGPKVDAIGAELEATRDTLRQVNERLVVEVLADVARRRRVDRPALRAVRGAP